MLFCHKPCGQVEGRRGLGQHEAGGLECGRNQERDSSFGNHTEGRAGFGGC